MNIEFFTFFSKSSATIGRPRTRVHTLEVKPYALSFYCWKIKPRNTYSYSTHVTFPERVLSFCRRNKTWISLDPFAFGFIRVRPTRLFREKTMNIGFTKSEKPRFKYEMYRQIRSITNARKYLPTKWVPTDIRLSNNRLTNRRSNASGNVFCMRKQNGRYLLANKNEKRFDTTLREHTDCSRTVWSWVWPAFAAKRFDRLSSGRTRTRWPNA